MKKQMPGKQVIAWSVYTMRHWEEPEPADFAGLLLPTHLVHVAYSYLCYSSLPVTGPLSVFFETVVCVCACVCPRMCACVSARMCVCVRAHVCVCVCVVTQSCLTLQPHSLQPTRLLCPWDSPGKSTGLGCHSLLQGIFLTQGSNPHLLHWQVGFLPLVTPGKRFRQLGECQRFFQSLRGLYLQLKIICRLER